MTDIEMVTAGNVPEVVSHEEWLAARRELLAKEKELTRARDGVNADRRWLPMVRIAHPTYSRTRTERCVCSTCSRVASSW